MEKAKTEEKVYAERLEFLKKQFQTQQEAFRKAAFQEFAEVRKDRLKRFQGMISRERGLLYDFSNRKRTAHDKYLSPFPFIWSCPSLVHNKQNFVMR